MFSVEIKFRVLGKEVRPEQFASLFLLEAVRTALKEFQLKDAAPAAPTPPPVIHAAPQSRSKKEPLAVSVNEAAVLIGISPATVRAYVHRRTINAVHIGRRVLTPLTAIHQLLEKGLQPARPREIDSFGAGEARQQYTTLFRVVRR